MYLIWQHVSTSECHLWASSIKYPRGTVYSCFKLGIEITVLQFDKICVNLSSKLYQIKSEYDLKSDNKIHECFNMNFIVMS